MRSGYSRLALAICKEMWCAGEVRERYDGQVWREGGGSLAPTMTPGRSLSNLTTLLNVTDLGAGAVNV